MAARKRRARFGPTSRLFTLIGAKQIYTSRRFRASRRGVGLLKTFNQGKHIDSSKLFDAAVQQFSEHLGPIAEVLVEEAFEMAKLTKTSGQLNSQQQFTLKTFLRGQLPQELDTSSIVREVFEAAKR